MSAYFVAKILVDIVPLRLIPNTVFIVITYFMAGNWPLVHWFNDCIYLLVKTLWQL